jgi:hypothetical protein
MKNLNLTSIVRSTLIASSLAIGSFASTASAVAQSGPTIIVNIPFDFQTDHQKMSAGLYRITHESSGMLLLRGPNEAAGMVLTHPAFLAEAPSKGYVAFQRYGNTYFLEQVWTAENSDGLQCLAGRAEKEMLKASAKPAPSLTKLALNSVPQR